MMRKALLCKVIYRRQRCTPRMIHDGFCEWVTVVETVSGDGRVLRPFIINKDVAHYMGWYTRLKKKIWQHLVYQRRVRAMRSWV